MDEGRLGDAEAYAYQVVATLALGITGWLVLGHRGIPTGLGAGVSAFSLATGVLPLRLMGDVVVCRGWWVRPLALACLAAIGWAVAANWDRWIAQGMFG